MTPERRSAIAAMGGAAVPSHLRSFSQDQNLAQSAGAAGGRISRGGGCRTGGENR